jgi:hypothetical protein
VFKARKPRIMRNITLILLGLMITINLSAQTNRRVIQLSGTVSEHPIKMTLSFHGDKILGFYYYEDKPKILLEGQLKGDQITLTESPNFQSEFIGDFKGGKFTGLWSDKAKNETLNFATSVNSDHSIRIANTITDMEGVYIDLLRPETTFSSLELRYITGDLYCFKISSGTESGCEGFVKGLINLPHLSGNYSGESCEEIAFSFLAKEFTLIEKNCDLHGMNCSFSGKYKKK